MVTNKDLTKHHMLDDPSQNDDDTRNNLRNELLKALERANVHAQTKDYLAKPENLDKLKDTELKALIDSYNQEADKKAAARGKIEQIADTVSKGFADDIESISKRRIAEAKAKENNS